MDSDDRAFKAGQQQERRRLQQIIEIRLDQLRLPAIARSPTHSALI